VQRQFEMFRLCVQYGTGCGKIIRFGAGHLTFAAPAGSGAL
jgi:trehalose utilization protein